MKILGRTILLIVSSLLALSVIGGGWRMWHFNRPPFDLALLNRLRPGMSAAEVQQILGAPKSVSAAEHEWAYSRPMAWPIVYVRFDEQWRFREHEYDY